MSDRVQDPGSGSEPDAAAADAAPAPAPKAPLRGRSGPLGEAALIRSLRNLGATGTLAVANAAGVSLTLLQAGETVARQALGEGPSENEADLAWAFHPHDLPAGPLHAVPELPAALPHAAGPALLSVPWLPTAHQVPAGLATLPTWVEWAGRSSATGVLLLQGLGDHTYAGLWCLEGRPVGAIAERDGAEVRRSDALRLAARLAADPAAADTVFLHLPESVALASLGVLNDQRRDAPTGLRIGERSTTLLRGGVPLLRTVHAPAERLGRFAALSEPQRLPTLALPDDPPDWETRRFALTLRGRDALDPMTELAMRFDKEFGPSGKRILTTLREGRTVRESADALGLDLDQLGAWIRRLEGEGMVRGRT